MITHTQINAKLFSNVRFDKEFNFKTSPNKEIVVSHIEDEY